MRIGLKTRIAAGLIALGAALGTTLAVPGMFHTGKPTMFHAMYHDGQTGGQPGMYYASSPNMYYDAQPGMFHS